jgi:DNA-binding NtrC family response regulator
MKMKILAVDDNSGTLNAIRVGLISYGYRVLTAHNAHEALTITQEAKRNCECVDLLLTDLTMPVINGLGLVLTAREIHPELYVIVMTTYGDDSHIVRQMKFLKGCWLLDKPFRPETLQKVIEKIFGEPK